MSESHGKSEVESIGEVESLGQLAYAAWVDARARRHVPTNRKWDELTEALRNDWFCAADVVRAYLEGLLIATVTEFADDLGPDAPELTSARIGQLRDAIRVAFDDYGCPHEEGDEEDL